MAVIETKDLTFTYFGTPVLRGVTFAVERGAFACITGSNGAGKSTLLKLLLGELHPQSGEILLLDTPADRFRQWPRIGYVPQNGAAMADGFPATVAEVVAMGRYPGPGRRRPGLAGRVEQALELVDMGAYAKRMVGRLSGGQIQRVLIARALVADSEVLLLDEPTTGVDTAAAGALYELLARLVGERGCTVLMVTHDVARAAGYATRMLCLEHGTMHEMCGEDLRRELEHRHRHHSKGGK